MHRCIHLCSLVLATQVCAGLRAQGVARFNPVTDTLAYVGTYTNNGKSQGIYLFRLSTQLEPLGLAAESASPSFLEADPKRRLIFAVNEVNTFDGKPTGAVSAFAIDPANGKLKLINQVASGGTGPCHVVLERTGRNLIVANYGGGTVAMIPVAPDGRLGEPTSVIQHTGKSVNPQRQQGPHAHCTTLDPANRVAFVCDLGLDKLVAYRIDAEHGRLAADDALTIATKPGAGPRHMAFRPDGKFAYVINELNSTVTAYAYDGATGKLSELQTESTLPPNFQGKSSCAEIAVHPSGRWLYASNRGRDSVVVFAIAAQTGRLTRAAEQSAGVKVPRHFALTPDAQHIVIANQNSDTLLLGRFDDRTGKIDAGSPVECPAPVCVLFVPPAAK